MKSLLSTSINANTTYNYNLFVSAPDNHSINVSNTNLSSSNFKNIKKSFNPNIILSRLISVDIKFNDEIQALLLLSSLPESWLGIVTAEDILRVLKLFVKYRRQRKGRKQDKGHNITEVDRNQRREVSRGTCKISRAGIATRRVTFRMCSKLVTSGDKEINMAAGDYDDALVRLADDKTLDIAGIGDVVLKTFFGTSWTLKDVRGNATLWHQRLGHMSEKGMKNLASKGSILDLQKAIVGFCEPYVYGPTSVASIDGSYYYVIFIDDSSRKLWVYFLKNKSEVFNTFKKWKAVVMLKIIPETPQQNGVAERMNRTLNERAKSMRLHAGLPKMFWEDSVTTTTYLINHGPSVPLGFRILKEEWQGKEVSLIQLRVFGCDSYVKVKDISGDKIDAKSVKCTFIGYGSDEMGYCFWDSKSHKVIRSKDVTFNEDSLYGAKATIDYSNLTKPIKWLRHGINQKAQETVVSRIQDEGFRKGELGSCQVAVTLLERYFEGYSLFQQKRVAGTTVSWMSRIQKCVTMSTTKVKYMAIAEADKELVWLENFLEELDKSQTECFLFCDNQSVIHLAKNPVFYDRTKHIKTRYHYIRELVSEWMLSLKKILGAKNPVDMLTKVVTTEKLKLCAASTSLRR
nr:retrovirus-related Pol polyprotein from transposon TNT 1-94 [Tanacetum cinerariifolium]